MPMISQVVSYCRLSLSVLTLTLGIWVLLVSSAAASGDDDGVKYEGNMLHYGGGGPGFGILGYGRYGVYPGYYGFGLKYHPGYGYGGKGLGVGADGGYPFYGGPGYPHPWPKLNRFCGITPFPYFGGPGFMGPPYCNFFGDPGQLVNNEDVVGIGDRSDDAAVGGYRYGSAGSSDYGMFSGAIPYSESHFGPFAAAAAALGSAAPRPPSVPVSAVKITTAREFGIDEEPVVEANGARGMKVTAVHPGTLAQAGGMKPGDIIRSLNHYLTLAPGDLGWIIANATPKSELTFYVRKQSDGKAHAVTVTLP
jgi:hypothetical protein